MGDEAAGTQPQIWLGRNLLAPAEREYQDVVTIIGTYYGIVDSVALRLLADDLVEIACYGQWRGDSQLADLRHRGRASALAVRACARRLQEAIDELNEHAIEFATVTQWSPHLLEEIFDLPISVDEEILIFPIINEISSLEKLSRRRGYWSHVRRRFDDYAALPVKDVDPGRIANTPLRHAVSACRSLWEGIEGKDWESFKLKEKKVRDANCIADLKNQCEQFVANMLVACGIDFDLRRLNSAWVAQAKKVQNMQRPTAI